MAKIVRIGSSTIRSTAFQRIVVTIMAFMLMGVGTADAAVEPASEKGKGARAEPLRFCVYDPVGATGVLYQKMQDYQLAALEWGVDLKLKPYTDERVAEDDFRSGQCDAVGLTGVRGRQFNAFTGTIDSIGAIPSYDHMASLLKTLAKPNAATLMRSGPYEVSGIVPAGQVFLFVNDREIDSVREMSGKRLGVLDADPAQKILSLSVGAAPVDSSVATLYSRFNNGSLDIVPGPAMAYDAMELEKGLSPTGGILDYAVAHLTIQVLIKHEQFPDAFGQRSRDYFVSTLNRHVEMLRASEQAIDAQWWVKIPQVNHQEYNELLRQARLSLRDKGIYDGKMLTVLRKVRCRKKPNRG